MMFNRRSSPKIRILTRKIARASDEISRLQRLAWATWAKVSVKASNLLIGPRPKLESHKCSRSESQRQQNVP